MLKFNNVNEVTIVLYILCDFVFGYLIVKTSNGPEPILALLAYEIISWLTFKRKTIKDALNGS